MTTWAVAGEDLLHLLAGTPASHEQDLALACYGARRQDTDEVLLYLCEGIAEVGAYLRGIAPK